MNHADGCGEPEFSRALRDGQRIFRILYSTTDNGINVDMKLRMFRQETEFLIQHAQTLARHLIGLDVINTNLEILETGFVQPFDTFGREVVAVRNQTRDHAAKADVVNDVVQLWMHHRLTTGDSNDRSAKIGELVES